MGMGQKGYRPQDLGFYFSTYQNKPFWGYRFLATAHLATLEKHTDFKHVQVEVPEVDAFELPFS